MVSRTSDSVIQVQPRMSSNSAIPLRTQVDENGEQIIKGIDVLIFLINEVSVRFSYPSILMRYLGSGPHCPSSDCCASDCCDVDGCALCIQPVQLYMYLTNTHVHIVRKTGTVTTFQAKVALIDITEIKAVGSFSDAGYCGLGTQVTSPATIMMELRPDGAKEFLPICCSYCNLPTVLTIHCNEDPTEFVAAVKQTLVTMPRE